MTLENLAKPGDFLFLFAQFQCASNAMLQQSSPAMPSNWSIYHSYLLASCGGGEKQAGSLTSQLDLLFSYPATHHCDICAMSASFPSSLFPAAESNPVSHFDEDHLFKRTKYNLEYMKYGQHKYSLLYLTVFCFLTLAYS